MQPIQSDISNAVTTFVTAGDNRNAEQMETILDPNFRVVFATGGNVSTLDRATYLSLLSSGKIGGEKREISLHKTQSDGMFAHASATLQSPKARFESQFTFIQRDGTWHLLQDATVFTPTQP